MDAHKIILDEWRESVADVVAGHDPLAQAGGMAKYYSRFPDRVADQRCSVQGCHSTAYRRGECQHHYNERWNHHKKYADRRYD